MKQKKNMERIWNIRAESQAALRQRRSIGVAGHLVAAPAKEAHAFAPAMLKSGMLSAIVIAPRAPANADRLHEAFVRSLTVLVGAAVADLVRDACILGPPGLRLESISDYAGCGLVEDDDARRGLEAALRAARSEHVFILGAGFAPMAGFIDEMSDWLLSPRPTPAALRGEAETLAQRLFPVLAPVAGLVARKAECLEAASGDAPALARELRAKTLRTRARRVV
jgi:hypothetical protein